MSRARFAGIDYQLRFHPTVALNVVTGLLASTLNFIAAIHVPMHSVYYAACLLAVSPPKRRSGVQDGRMRGARK